MDKKHLFILFLLLVLFVTNKNVFAYEYEISYGESGRGEISANNQYDYWQFEGSAGDEIEINMFAYGEIDAYIVLWYYDGNDWQFLDENDNNNSARNKWDATIWATLPKDGYYSVVASSAWYSVDNNQADAHGEYEIRIDLLTSEKYLDAPAKEEDANTGFENCGIAGCDDYGDPGEYCEVEVVDIEGFIDGSMAASDTDFQANEGDEILVTVTVTSGDLLPELWVWHNHSTGAEAIYVMPDDNEDGFIYLQDMIKTSGNYSVGVSQYDQYTEGWYRLMVTLSSANYCQGGVSDSGNDDGRAGNVYDDGEMIIAVIDSGVDATSELAGVLMQGYNYIADNQNTADTEPSKHGTGVASTIHDYAPWSTIMPLVVDGYANRLGEAIEYAVSHGADIINISISRYTSSCKKDWQQALDYAYSQGVLVFTAVGNLDQAEYYDQPETRVKYPAGCNHSWGVGAIWNDQIISVRNASVDFIALSNSTSHSTAMASALAANIWDSSPNLSSGDVVGVMISSAYLPSNAQTDQWGAGLLDIE